MSLELRFFDFCLTGMTWTIAGVLRNWPEGLVQWLRSVPPNPQVPSSIPGLVEGWIFGWPSFPLKFTQLFILSGSVKWVPANMDRFEAAARGAYICFRSAGGKLIIVKRLWACYMEKALYKCTTSLFYFFNYQCRVVAFQVKFCD